MRDAWLLVFTCAACGGAAPSSAIDGGGVGPVRIGRPLPARVMPGAQPVSRIIADGVEIVGFRLAAPPVLAVLRERRVRAVHVEDPGPRTAKGAGVGSTLAELRGAHGEVRSHAVPTTYGGDECVAIAGALPVVWFYFASCAAAEAGARVVRVIVADPDDDEDE
jgi:hypothetical protein